MSFLNSVLSSIDSGNVPPPPPAGRNETPPSSTGTNTASSKPALKEQSTSQGKERQGAGQKRKADFSLRPTSRLDKSARPSPIRSTPPKATPSSKSSDASKTTPSKPVADSKPPPKGSYADIMAQAKALQNKVPTNLGTIRHQTAQKERRSKVQQKRLAKEAKQRELEDKKGGKLNGSRSTSSSTTAGKLRDMKLGAAEKPAEPEYKGTAKRPPQDPTGPAYAGTAGRPSRHGPPDRKAQARSSRMDEYLATDEEDEGDFEEQGYYSDESTDMEAGIMDMETEEQAALRIAKEEDERELRMEMTSKKEKLARKKKFEQLAAKGRR